MIDSLMFTGLYILTCTCKRLRDLSCCNVIPSKNLCCDKCTMTINNVASEHVANVRRTQERDNERKVSVSVTAAGESFESDPMFRLRGNSYANSLMPLLRHERSPSDSESST